MKNALSKIHEKEDLKAGLMSIDSIWIVIVAAATVHGN